MPPFAESVFAIVNSGVAAGISFRTCRKSVAFPHIDGQSPKKITCAWFEIKDFSEGLAAVEVEVTDNSIYRGYRDRKYGFIDRAGRFVIPPQFYRVNKFSEGRALFSQTGKRHGYGFIDATGRVVINAEYADGKDFSEGLAAVAVQSTDEKKIWGYVNKEGQWAIKPKFHNANSFSGGLAAVNCDEYGARCQAYVDRTGSVRWPKPI